MTNRPIAARTDRIVRIAVYAAVVVSLAVGAALVYWKSDLERWIANNVSSVGGPFTLTTQDGETFTRADLLGHPHAIYFGFTFCPDLCPTTLFQLASIVKGLGDKAAPLKVVFVSVDPERDTPAVMKEYLSAFDDGFIGLTGTPEAVARAAKAYRIFYSKVPLEDGGYTMDHSASVLLFDADGSYVDSIKYDEPDAEARATIERLIDASAGS